tara:strand:+ start:201 stop:545 length:345 start_codon:yes stop_codon:yes gene_type:complete
MDLKQRYTEGYFVDEEFVEALHQFDVRTASKIAHFIDENVTDFPINDLTSTILGGIIPDDKENPLTFAIEIVREEGYRPTLSDVKEISIDEYLDLYNLNLIIKNGEERSTGADT